ncbi:MAG: hypothetical protein ABIC68_03495 [Candidatus Omnitrophota bacterium]
MLKQKGSVLIIAYVFLFALLLLGGVFFSRSVADKKLFDIQRERTEAFYLAEAAVDRALVELKNNFAYTGTTSVVDFMKGTTKAGEYEISVSPLTATRRQVITYGYIPVKTSARAQRCIEAIVKKETPPNFFDYAIYSAGIVDPHGNTYAVNGDVVYADSIDNSSHISGTVTHDATVAPLAAFDFAILRAIAVAQGNLYDATRLDAVKKNWDTFPANFWYSTPTDASDPTTGIPNVVYVEGDLVLNGNIGSVGGFFLVVGNVLTDPDDTADSTLNGNGTVDGCIYTTGKFDINGGGGNLNVNGGVWSGTEAELNGNVMINYNIDFMDSIEFLVQNQGAGSVVQLLTWREL